jgi:hypothetical protein
MSKPLYPDAVDPAMVKQYPLLCKSGAGYVWDAVLEWRVWGHGAGDDQCHCFVTYDDAEDYHQSRVHTEPPLALVLQKSHINEPEPGKLVYVDDAERITEWQAHWICEENRNTPENRERIMNGWRRGE